MCRWVSGFPKDLGGPVVSAENPGGRYRVTNSRPALAHSSCAGAKFTSASVVPPSEGNEVRREGRQEVVVP
jgi:hypothetical protein